MQKVHHAAYQAKGYCDCYTGVYTKNNSTFYGCYAKFL